MLSPHDRKLLLESLRPPAGYALDRALGTTYSLDLLAMLTVPLSFTFFDWEEGEEPTSDSLALFEALRRYADRVTVFCQEGGIHVPRKQQKLFAYLEEAVHQVKAPEVGGVFHPKLWVLRFNAKAGPVRYRLICLSRNLTFDRSWDAMVVLDGEVMDRDRAIAVNHPLAEFVEHLPMLAVRPLTPERVDQLKSSAEELRKVRWDLPEGFEEVRFWPMGLDGKESWPFRDDYRRMLVVSPFLEEKVVSKLAKLGTGNILVGRLEELQQVNPRFLKGYERLFCLHPKADPEPLDDEGPIALSGLHAKVYLADAGWNAHVWVGSANATNAAFRRNVEFLVELVGKKSRFGIDTVMKSDGDETPFSSLLLEFIPGKDQPEVDEEQQKLEKKAEEVKSSLLSAGPSIHVLPTGEDEFEVRLTLGKKGLLKDVPGAAIKCWPVTLVESSARPVTGGDQEIARFAPVAFESLTTFVAFEVRLVKAEKNASLRFVLNLPMVGAPTDRRERILHSILGNPGNLMRFLLFLLADSGMEGAGALLSSPQELGAARGGEGAEPFIPLLESLMRALDRNPAALDEVSRLIKDLNRTPQGRELLPPGFESIWDPIWTVRQESAT